MEAAGAAEMAAVMQMHFMIFVFFGQFVMHVDDSEDVNAAGDQRHHRKHHERQAVNVPIQRQAQPPNLAKFIVRPGKGLLTSGAE